jgi:hypothetical protein
MAGSTNYSDRVLLTIHGVTSDNTRLTNFCAECKKRLPGLITDSHYYQYFVPFGDLTAATRDLIFQSVQDKIELVWVRDIVGKNRKLFVLAHSFGTLAVIRALEMHIPDVTIEGLVLLGSIVKRAYRWDGFIRSGQLRHPPLAIIRPFDMTVRFAGPVSGEDSGAKGFISTGQYAPIQTYKKGGHVSYFPDDVDDVVATISGGVDSVQLTTYAEWKARCHWLDRVRHFFL